MLLALLWAGGALADPAADCHAAQGQFLTGQVMSNPRFVPGRTQEGVELSHTQLKIRADQDGRIYQVAIDNVFAAGYDMANPRREIPAPLNGIRQGDQLELCGLLYDHPLGIHWVHTNCGAPPTPKAPDGWLRKIGPHGERVDNMEDVRKYCRLWPAH